MMNQPLPEGGVRPAARNIAYIVNRYPTPSHSFIRREILALEALGCAVHRFSVRAGMVVDDSGADAEEAQRTDVILPGGLIRLIVAALPAWLMSPVRSVRTALLALRLGYSSDRGVLRHIAYFVEATVLSRRLGAEVEWLHAHFGTNSATVAMLCSEFGGTPFSFTVHGPEEFERALGIGLRLKIGRARFVAVITDFCRSQVWQAARFSDWPKAVKVRCGVDAVFLDPPRTPVPDGPELLWVGRFAPQKGIPVLIEACKLLSARGINFRLTLVGGGDFEKWTRAEIEAAALTRQVTMVGWQNAEQIRERLDASRGLIMASFAEGLPVVLMESMARERPVIATRIAGIPELVEHGVTGWLVTAARPDLLADAIEEMLACPQKMIAEMGRIGRARVESEHDSQREAHSLLAAIDTNLKLANGRGAR